MSDIPQDEKNIPENPEDTSSIQNEDDFREAILEVKEKQPTDTTINHFDHLSQELHQSLQNQDSEKALSLITRGALGFGSSDIHYDSGEHTIDRVLVLLPY